MENSKIRPLNLCLIQPLITTSKNNAYCYIEKQILFSTNHIQALLKQIVKEKTSCIHTLFCTKETLKFYSKSDLHNKIPLIVNLPMSSDEILDQVNNLNFSFCSASIWNYNSKEDTNLEFKKKEHNLPD